MSRLGDRNVGGKNKPINKRDYELKIYCGGLGGGGCAQAVGTSLYQWSVENDKSAVVNRFLAMEYNGVFTLYTDGGPHSFLPAPCREAGDAVPMYVAVSPTPNISSAEIIAQNVIIGFGIPAIVEFDEKLLPQPTDPLYEGRTWVTVYWGNPGYVTELGIGASFPMRTIANLSNVEI